MSSETAKSRGNYENFYRLPISRINWRPICICQRVRKVILKNWFPKVGKSIYFVSIVLNFKLFWLLVAQIILFCTILFVVYQAQDFIIANLASLCLSGGTSHQLLTGHLQLQKCLGSWSHISMWTVTEGWLCCGRAKSECWKHFKPKINLGWSADASYLWPKITMKQWVNSAFSILFLAGPVAVVKNKWKSQEFVLNYQI